MRVRLAVLLECYRRTQRPKPPLPPVGLLGRWQAVGLTEGYRRGGDETRLRRVRADVGIGPYGVLAENAGLTEGL